jgi:hypothetical protein
LNTRNREFKNEEKEIEQPLEIFFSNISKAEKLFWGTIVVFFIVFGIISIIAISRSQDIVTQIQKEPVTIEFIEKLFPSGIVKDNIIKNEKKINQNLNLELQQMYSSVDREIDNLFYPIEQNIDKFLDFHYSVIGEYTELGSIAFGDINKIIEEKLFGKDFANRINQSSKYMQEQYRIKINSHLSTVDKYATKGVDKNINNEALRNLQESIKNNTIRLSVQATAPVGVMLGVKLAAVISSKIAVKATAKGVTKASSKIAAKTTAAGTGAVLGTICGPFFWICSPVAASTLWVATDIIVVSGDEYFTRDELKKEILQSLNDSKIRLKNSYKEVYYKSFQEFSKNVRNEYNNIVIQEKRLIKVKDRF